MSIGYNRKGTEKESIVAEVIIGSKRYRKSFASRKYGAERAAVLASVAETELLALRGDYTIDSVMELMIANNVGFMDASKKYKLGYCDELLLNDVLTFFSYHAVPYGDVIICKSSSDLSVTTYDSIVKLIDDFLNTLEEALSQDKSLVYYKDWIKELNVLKHIKLNK